LPNTYIAASLSSKINKIGIEIYNEVHEPHLKYI